MTDFVAGDRVAVANWDGPGKVLFGPYSAGTFSDELGYLVANSDGRAASVRTSRLSHAPAFAVGDSAQYTLDGRTVTVVAGPYRAGHEWYVMQGSDGKQYSASAQHLVPVAEPSRTFALNGAVFDLDARYQDRDGDAWEFTNGLDEDDKTPIMRCGPGPGGTLLSLNHVVCTWGPLTAAATN